LASDSARSLGVTSPARHWSARVVIRCCTVGLALSWPSRRAVATAKHQGTGSRSSSRVRLPAGLIMTGV
jgi:hypothetical protein